MHAVGGKRDCESDVHFTVEEVWSDLALLWSTTKEPEQDECIDFRLLNGSSNSLHLFFMDADRNQCVQRVTSTGTELPLAEISGARIDLCVLERLVEHGRKHVFFDEAMNLLREDAFPDELSRVFNEKQELSPISRHFGAEDITTIHGVSEDCLDPLCISQIFKVQKDQQSSRLIWDGRSFNRKAKSMHPVPAVEFPRLPQLIDSLLQYQFKLQVDAKHYFYQIPISSKLSKFFGFRCGSKRGDVLATGIQCTTNGNVLFTDSWAINFYDDLHARH